MATKSGWHRKRMTPAVRRRKAQYDSAEHRAMRKQLQAQVDAGRGCCWRCGRTIPPGAEWHAGHDDDDRAVYRGVECPPCNRKTAASRGATIRNRAQRVTRVRL